MLPFSPDFQSKIAEHHPGPFVTEGLSILQLNITRKCNLSCRHCHASCGPDESEEMSSALISKALELAKSPSVELVDITGGAPEMHADLPRLLRGLKSLEKKIIVRTNLVILDSPEYSHFIGLYRECNVNVVGSFPYFIEEKYAKQRGGGMFEKTLRVLRRLNEVGYGKGAEDKILSLVHNPGGAYLPGSQKALESEFRTNLLKRYEVTFDNLFCIVNMPIGRYHDYLKESGNLEDYMSELCGAFNPDAAKNVMCKATLNVAPNGDLYNCDFNQMIGLKAKFENCDNLIDLKTFPISNDSIVIANHCYGCTAGSGSSCRGATVS